MHVHTVKSGECLSVIAKRHGFADYKTIYDHPDNAELKKKRPNPNLIYPGDEVVIPEKGKKAEKLGTGKTHDFILKRPKKALRLVILDHEGKPLSNEPGVLRIGRQKIEVRTDGKGKLEEMVSVDERDATLTIAGRVLELRFGHLNPIDDAPDGGLTGAKGRLRNLGYDVPDAINALDDSTRAALELYQHDHKLDVTGELDEATAKNLVATYGC